MSDTEPVEVTYDAEVEESETDRAKLFYIDGSKVWIPKSQIIDEDSDESTVTIPEWLAIEKELV